MRQSIRFLVACLLAGLAAAQSGTPIKPAPTAQEPSPATCLPYEPTVVRITGTLVRKTFPGPPNYEDIRRGDAPEVSWILELSPPICVDEDTADPDLNPARKDVREVQLVVDPKIYKSHKKLVGKRVIAEGTLFGGHTIHHRTDVLLMVSALTKAD